MESYVDEWLDKIDDAIDTRLELSGFEISNNIKDSIREQGLIDTALMLNDIRHVKTHREVRSGSTIGNPPYPFFLNNGFRHYQSGEIVGPYRFMEKGVSNAEGTLRAIWKQPIK